MTTTRRIPKLLGTAQSYSIQIDLGPQGGRVTISYSCESVARTDYERYRTQMAYAGYWIKGISYNEHIKD